MGHALSIHNKIYRQKPVLQDIRMVKMLDDALGVKSTDTVIALQRDNVDHLSRACSTPVNNHMLDRISDDDIDSATILEPNLSTINEDEDYHVQSSRKPQKGINKNIRFRRQTRKRTWTTPERKSIRETFNNFLQSNDNVLPTLETCQEFASGNPHLKDRAPQQIRAWIIREKRKSGSPNKGWTTPVKDIVRKQFTNYYKTGEYPSSSEMSNAIQEHEELRHTSVPKLRSHLQHDLKYLKRKSL
uniref:Uncharacterized protein LOC114336161 n=1 Tax=Diabrotica virgifera virgifera TaxID=50390 RepID=A0A6P7G0F1_DIAVI